MQILNPYIKNLNRVEFVTNNSCTSRCKHCSQGNLKGTDKLDPVAACDALRKLAVHYKIDSIMTFGGEALLCPDTVAAIHQTAKECQIPERQLITNGFFSKDRERIKEVAHLLENSGVNDILLSVDCFHAEHLPLETVKLFAQALKDCYTGSLRLQPSWVRSRKDNNPYNCKTLECLSYFDDLEIPHNEGDVIFPLGNATRYLGEYFEKKPIDLSFHCGDAMYTSDLREIDSISINCNGDVLPCSFPMGNIYENDILTILRSYDPYRDPLSKALIEGGIAGLIEVANKQGVFIDPDDYYSPCEICNAIFQQNSNH
ncbi:hypothetical protein lbkm_1267 [Lachnospiraceae bacterium KM106-2]|nr:hypothetical protein lbkm_1267 [Lachnospiraceae bacterium KM106-2]